MKIEIGFDNEDLYSVSVDGYVIMECLSEEDVSDLTIGDISEIRSQLKFGWGGVENDRQ